MEYEAILTSTETIQGYKSGICLIKSKNSFVNLDKIKDKIKYCKFKEGYHDCYDIDYKLYKSLASIKLNDIVAIGCNISIDWMPYNTGGIIGSPHSEAESSNELVEMINSDLAMYSSPGKIGFVAECSKNTMESILKDINFSLNNEELVNNVLDTFLDFGINTVIVITDGCGVDSKGYAAILNNGVKKVNELSIMHY